MVGKRINMAFMDIEKVIWRAMRNSCVEKRIVKLVQRLYWAVFRLPRVSVMSLM